MQRVERWGGGKSGGVGVVVVLAAVLYAMNANAQPGESDLREAQPATTGEASNRRPRIGLVLGGGGAKGSAHIGVLGLLEELRIPIDCIAATSMGALVGATYASGSTAAEIEEQVLEINWGYTLGRQGSRDQMPIERKLFGSGYSNTLEVGLRDGRLLGRGGLIETQNVESVIWKLVANAQATGHFDDLPIPFRAIATDVISGEMVVLDEGELPIAMRASMAIPGAFSPVEIDDMVLVDGGLTRNLPIDVARELCADVVIAVWFTSPPPEKADVATSLSLINRALDVMVTANQNDQIATLSDSDVGIAVAAGDIGTSQFDRSPEAIKLGRETAERQRSSLERYSVSEQEYFAWQQNVHRDVDPSYEIAEVHVVDSGRVNPDYVRSKLESAQAGVTVRSSEIVADTERLYALGDFERIEYRMRGPADARVLEIEPVEKSWGPNFLHFDLGLTTQDGADLSGLLRVDHERTWINSLGGRWHNGVQIGRQSILETDFYQPLDVSQRFFVQPALRFDETVEDIYIEGDRLAAYKIRELYGQLDFGMNIGSRLQLRAGLQHGWHRADLDTGLPGLPGQPRENDTNLQLRVLYDTRDSIALPTKGSFFSARYVNSLGWFDSVFDYDMVEGVLSKAYSLRGNSLSVLVGGGSAIKGEVPITQEIVLGGIHTFPGLRPGELRGQDYWFVGTSYLWRLIDIQPIFGQAIYAGVRLQAAQMNGQYFDENDDPLFGISGSLSGRTPVGAFILSLGYVDDGSLRLQFTVGRPVAEGSLLDAVR